MVHKNKLIISVILSLCFILSAVSSARACTFEATILDKHLDFKITSDTNKLRVIQYIRRSGNALVTAMYAPEVGYSWNYSDDPNCNISLNDPVGCRQIRPEVQSGVLGTGAFWQWYDWPTSQFHLLSPSGWGLDFDSTPSYTSIGIEYWSYGGNEDGTFCTYTGNISTPNPTPSETPTFTPTSTPTETLTTTPTLSPTPSPIPSPTPSLTPTSSPTQSSTLPPTPSSTQIPITKIIFIPGMGANWNVDAFINCKNTGYSGDWTLAPYAKQVYDNFLTQVPLAGWNLIDFHYDWRQDVRENSSNLAGLINSITVQGEMVNIVGHSMGGLIGRNYLESLSGGKAAKLIMVGAPNQGSALAYPLFVSGEVWTNDLIERIATELFIKRCGTIKSTQNILPTYNYLRDFRTRQIKNTSTMKVKNNYLPTNFLSPFWGVKVGTLVGTGQPTLKFIDVIKSAKWPDGRPVGRENVNDGDGTVLTESAQIPGAFSNSVINQTHSGIIGSTEGINKILEFLGSPGIDDPPFVEPKSALVLIGYPGNFWIKDRHGIVTQSENGIIALMDPDSEDYQLQMIPTSTKTDFIIAQFLTDRQTLFKEYIFKGLIIEPKTVEFSTTHPKGDILRSTSHTKPPRPCSIWRFWHRCHN